MFLNVSVIALAVVVAFACYGIGFSIIYAFKTRTRDVFEIFYALVIGLSILTSVYSLIATNGQTVLALLPILVLGPVWFRHRMPDLTPVFSERNKQTPALTLLILPISIVVFALVLYAFNHDPITNQVMTVSRDYAFYSKTSYALNVKAAELPFINALSEGPLNPQPYHYLDLWCSALLVKLTNLSAMALLNTVVYSLMLTILFIGFAAIYERYITRYPIVFIMAVFSVFIWGMYLPAFQYFSLLENTKPFNLSMIPVTHPKIISIFIFTLLGYYFLLEGRIVSSAWIWSSLALVYTVVAPAAYLGGGCLVIYFLFRKKISLPIAWRALAAYKLVTGYIGVFYWLPNYLHPAEQNHSLGYLQYLPDLHNLHGLRTVLKVSVGTLLAQLFYYGPYLLFIIVLLFVNGWPSIKWRGFESIIVSSVLFMISSTVVGAVFFRSTDGYQLGLNLLLPVIIIGIIIMLGISLQYSSVNRQVFSVVILGVLMCYNLRAAANSPYEAPSHTRHDVRFLQQISVASPNLSRYGGLMLDRSEYKNVFDFNGDISTVGMYLGLVRNSTVLLSLSIADFDQPSLNTFLPDTSFVRYAVSSAPFTQFVRKQKQSGNFTSLSDAQRGFLMQHGINFICASPGVHLPLALQLLVRRTINDPVSKQVMYILDVPLQPKSQPMKEQIIEFTW